MTIRMSPPAHHRRRWSSLALVGGLAGTVALRASKQRGDGGARTPQRPSALQFAPADLAYVESTPLARWLPVSGTLQPMRQAVVKAKVAGDLAEFTVREGEPVRAGQKIARIDSADLQSRLVDRLGAVESARAQLALAEKTRTMNVRLLNDKFISQNAFDSTESSFNVARGTLKSAEAQLQLAQNALRDAEVTAPLSGIVAKRHVQPGEKIAIEGAGRHHPRPQGSRGAGDGAGDRRARSFASACPSSSSSTATASGGSRDASSGSIRRPSRARARSSSMSACPIRTPR